LERHSPNIDRFRRRGFTLVESLIASVVLAVAVVGIAGTLAASYQQARDQVSVAEATQLARQLIEEISARPFEVPAGSPSNAVGWSAGNPNRAIYDDISDYHGYTDNSTSITTQAGVVQSFGTAGPYERFVTVTEGPVPQGHTAPAIDFKQVKVTVTRPGGSAVVISKVFTRANLAN
jgi:prepilin-type N-terminal cleavage/methylation domain-containing protein